ncbi:MAG: hypothetical protein AB7N91_28535 [Candidatus Tectimicrobiota bacterium]
MQQWRVFLVLSLVLVARTTVADDAAVLPQGRWHVGAEARVSLPITKQFTPSGGTEDLAVNFNRNLDRLAFPDLQSVETGFRLPAGTATFGRSVVDFTRHLQIYAGQAAYGLTDRLTVGLRVPYWTQDIKVTATLDTRTATVGFNPAVPGGVAPLRVPGTRVATIDDIQGFITRLGFRRVQRWADASFSDLFGTLKYQYYRTAPWRLAVSGTVRFPTGRWEDPNNLVDYPTGYGAWGLGVQLHQDYRWSPFRRTAGAGVRSPGDVLLSTSVRYEVILPDTKAFRVCNINQPLCPNYDPQVHRDVGDLVEAEVATTVGLLPGLTLTPQYTYVHKFPDHFRGNLGFPYGELTAETDVDSHILDVRLTYSTASLVAAKRFPVPVSVGFLYTDRLASTNSRLQTRYLGVSLTSVW